MRVLLFDIDGTLLLTNGGGKRALKQALELEFGVRDGFVDLDFSGRTDRSLLEEVLLQNQLSRHPDHFRRLRDRYVSLFPAVLTQQGGRVLPGAIELLERLRGCQNLVCHVMTGNVRETATCKLEYFGLRNYFGEIFGGEHDVQRDSLARRTAASLRTQYGAEALREMIVIGDTPADVRCGHAVGARVIAVCSGRHGRAELEAEHPMSVHDDLTDVFEILEQF